VIALAVTTTLLVPGAACVALLAHLPAAARPRSTGTAATADRFMAHVAIERRAVGANDVLLEIRYAGSTAPAS
jgi:hypothetical protein